ncbi:MAG: thioredoxin domain-containing protein, partial [Verrucomicrobiota bacterium]
MSAQGEEGRVRLPFPTPKEVSQLSADGGDEFNRLVFEASPYLQQHARNTVDWFPWSEEAFAKAAAENKPVLLSVGYATCHWCHVMEHECFEDAEVGAYLQEHFVSIKVDREERPDVDDVYMTVTQAMSGRGGWPMTVLMTAERRPFFAGTYFPKEDRVGRLGFMTLLRRTVELWSSDRVGIEENAEELVTYLRRRNAGMPGDLPSGELFEDAFQHYVERFDREHGGFGRAPKFPTPQRLSFLLRYHHRTGNDLALEMVETSLRAMREGGLYDQVGFGTHRYSTDAEWLLPHFEKMLYDQAFAVIANAEAYQVTGDPYYAQTCREILEYVTRDMTHEEGGFFSAEDADSEGVEGRFYVWTPEEVIDVLGEEDGALWNQLFGIVPGGNFEEEATKQRTGESIPHLGTSIAEFAKITGRKEEALVHWIEEARRKLFAQREKRIHPQKDDKVLTDWNGLMISAFAKAAQALQEPAYYERAKMAAQFARTYLTTDEGFLLKRYRRGTAGLTAHLEDYAFLSAGFLDLYETGYDLDDLQECIRLMDFMMVHFWDEERDGFYMTGDQSEALLVRPRKIYGGAIPSGNAV